MQRVVRIIDLGRDRASGAWEATAAAPGLLRILGALVVGILLAIPAVALLLVIAVLGLLFVAAVRVVALLRRLVEPILPRRDGRANVRVMPPSSSRNDRP